MASSNRNIFRVTDPLWLESTAHTPIDSPHKGQWSVDFIFYLMCTCSKFEQTIKASVIYLTLHGPVCDVIIKLCDGFGRREIFETRRILITTWRNWDYISDYVCSKSAKGLCSFNCMVWLVFRNLLYDGCTVSHIRVLFVFPSRELGKVPRTFTGLDEAKTAFCER